MTLKEAIKEAESLATHDHVRAFPKKLEALMLGIEALKLVNAMGECPYCHVGFTLPGETEE